MVIKGEQKMKKKILLIATVIAAVFTGCSGKTEDIETNGENNTAETVAVTDLLGSGCYAMPTLRI